MLAMWPYYPELLAAPVPRYTSYPTAAEFGNHVGPEDHARALASVAGEVSLYVHIPFCEKICWYCGCNTSTANRRDRVASYLDALHREIAQVGARLPSWAHVGRVAFGGGSPNAIQPIDFVRLLDLLTLHFRLTDPVLSIEIDPRIFSSDWVEVLAGSRIARASLGVQTTAPHLQRAIGRIQPQEDIARTVEGLRKAGVSSLNFDLMYGLPGQSREDLSGTLDFARDHGADRIALFGYAHVPHLIARQRKIAADALPGQAERFAMAALGHARLTEEGYCPVGFDHFALPGDPLAMATVNGRLHRNFQGFTDDAAPVLVGLGASAISHFPDLLIQNEKNMGRYRMMLSQDRLPASRGIVRSAQDRQRSIIIQDLLCHGRASVDPALLSVLQSRLAPFASKGLVAIGPAELTITPHGLPYARSIAAQFDAYREASPQRFSSAV